MHLDILLLFLLVIIGCERPVLAADGTIRDVLLLILVSRVHIVIFFVAVERNIVFLRIAHGDATERANRQSEVHLIGLRFDVGEVDNDLHFRTERDDLSDIVLSHLHRFTVVVDHERFISTADVLELLARLLQLISGHAATIFVVDILGLEFDVHHVGATVVVGMDKVGEASTVQDGINVLVRVFWEDDVLLLEHQFANFVVDSPHLFVGAAKPLGASIRAVHAFEGNANAIRARIISRLATTERRDHLGKGEAEAFVVIKHVEFETLTGFRVDRLGGTDIDEVDIDVLEVDGGRSNHSYFLCLAI